MWLYVCVCVLYERWQWDLLCYLGSIFLNLTILFWFEEREKSEMFYAIIKKEQRGFNSIIKIMFLTEKNFSFNFDLISTWILYNFLMHIPHIHDIADMINIIRIYNFCNMISWILALVTCILNTFHYHLLFVLLLFSP